MTHEIKLLEFFADAVLSGEKSFEIRENDRGYQKGDKVKFRIVNHVGLHISHPVEEKVYRITFVINGWGLKDGYVVFGIKEKPIERFDVFNERPREVVCIRDASDGESSHFPNVDNLEKGKKYFVTHVERYDWSTEVFLEEFPQLAFNSCGFAEVDEDE